ncbi:MAG: TonB family protein [Ignavibacteria bacterium]|nr:TonB family protein [Ignavibacteria bacterium]
MPDEKNINQQVGFTEPLFEKMKYGAPELMKVYKKFALGGLIVAIFFHAFFIAAYAFSEYIEAKRKEEELRKRQEVVLKDIQSTQSEEESDKSEAPPEVEEVQQVKQVKDLEQLNPEPAAREKADIDKLKSVEEQMKETRNIGKEDIEGKDIISEGPIRTKEDVKKIEEVVKQEEKKEITKVDKEKTYKQFEVDKAPQAVNLAAVRASMRYPEIAKQNGIEGRVSVQVLVGTDGSVIQVGSYNGPDVFRDEVMSKVTALRFTPAIQQGNAVKCWVTVPFNFTLKQEGFKKKDDEEKKEEKEEKKEQPKKEEN